MSGAPEQQPQQPPAEPQTQRDAQPADAAASSPGARASTAPAKKSATTPGSAKKGPSASPKPAAKTTDDAAPAATDSPSPSRANGTYTRPTAASQSMSPGRATSVVGAPKEVEELAHMSPRQRVLYEFRQKREHRPKHPSSVFAPGLERQGLLGRGNLKVRTSKTPEFKTAQAKRAWEQQQERQSKVEKEAHYEPPRPMTFNARKWKEPMKIRREKAAGLWARSTGERFMFNFPWAQFPEATPQKSLFHRAPGPGSYGKSTSFAA